MNLPSGTVTFLFTDIEGSTSLWEHYPVPMRQALALHDALLRATIESHHGHVFKSVGDAFCAAFPTAPDALAAARAAQIALLAQDWTRVGALRVRMALHTGAAEERDGDYFGPPLNRVARLLAIGHGGQVLLSQAARDLLPADASLTDQGTHRLKDLQQPEHVFQLCAPDLPSEFPPLRSLRNTNLPLQTTSFIGRDQEMAELKALFPSTSLLTLTGTGGCGKTRLALQMAADLAEDYPDGVWLVELAALSDGRLVAQQAASVLGLREPPGRSLTQTLTDHLKSRTLLLLLDNCEHLLADCALLAETLLRSCPHLKLLATSREALNIPGEQTWRVPSLLPPDPSRLPSEEKDLPAVLMDYDAVRLFVERAQAHRSDFTLTRQNGPAVAQVCHRLDGIPLALELAAARVRGLTAEQVAVRLEDRFGLLTGGSRTAPSRQQTLRATLDWSYDLLSEKERRLLGRLSVFAGGWTLEAVENVCAGAEIEEGEILDLLTSLLDKSLVAFEARPGEVEGRYRLLETIRQYARERLAATGVAAGVQGRHLAYFLALAEQVEPHLTGPEQVVWLARLEDEHDNLRSALAWCQGQEEQAEAGLRLTTALWPFWHVRGYYSVGRAYQAEALSRAGPAVRTQARAKALDGAGALAWRQSDYEAARALHEESLSIWRELGDKQGIAQSLHNLGIVAYHQGDYSAARALHEESLSIWRELGDKQGIAQSLNMLGNVANNQGDYSAARALHEQSLAIRRELGNKHGIASSLINLGNVAINQGDHAAAQALYEESLAITRELGNKHGIAIALENLGAMARRSGDYAQAHRLLTESLEWNRQLGLKGGELVTELGLLAADMGDGAQARRWFAQALGEHRETGRPHYIAIDLEGLAHLARQQSDWDRAARLWGAAESLREAVGTPLLSEEREEYERDQAAVREALGEEAFAAAWVEGGAMTMEQAIAYALQEA
jgi:predicted ATPase/class 3 adenylate cyclase